MKSSPTRLFAVIAMVAVSAAGEAQTVVTPSNPQGWGIDPFHAPITGAQGITTNEPRNGLGSLEMTVLDNGAQQTGYGLFVDPGTPLGSLSDLTSLGFDWSAQNPALQSPTFRLYATVDNPSGGTMIGQFGWYADGSINGSVPVDTWTTSDLLAPTNNNFFFRLFSDPSQGYPSGQVGTNCIDSNRGSDFNNRMQSLAAWESTCNGTGGTIDLSTASIFAVSLDMGRFGSNGTTAYQTNMDMVRFGFAGEESVYNFEPDAQVSATPEPATLALLIPGFIGMVAVARRRKSA